MKAGAERVISSGPLSSERVTQMYNQTTHKHHYVVCSKVFPKLHLLVQLALQQYYEALSYKLLTQMLCCPFSKFSHTGEQELLESS